MQSENVKIEKTKDGHVLKVDPTVDLGPSTSGKTRLVAKCREVVDGVTYQLSAYRK